MNLVQSDDHMAAIATATSAAQPGMQPLTPLEITAVAGGPEGSVGTGLNPP